MNLLDAYIEARLTPEFRLRVGKARVPFGFERLQRARYLTFVERALPSSLGPNREIGVQVLGDVAGGMVSYQAGVFSGDNDGSAGVSRSGGGREVAARVVARPFGAHGSTVLSKFGIAVAASSGGQPDRLPTFATSGNQTFFAYGTSAAGVGVRRRISPQYCYSNKRVATFGEYVRSSGRVATQGTSEEVAYEAVAIAGSVMVTGEAASDRGVKPHRPFNPAARAWGALQLAARYHTLWVDPRAVIRDVLVPDSSRTAKAFTVGANWYLNHVVQWMAHFERTTFDAAADRGKPAENVFLVRSQVAF